MPNSTSRRRFLQLSAALAAGTWIQGCASTQRKFKPGEKLNLGVIGVGNRGAEDLEAVAGENILALCDVDRDYLLSASKLHPGAHLYADFRDMLLCEKLDAVLVATPDHTHAVATAAALHAGLDVYCEKPLTHSLAEARYIADLAREKRAVTQMGIQIHAQENYHRVVELVRAGSVGPCTRCTSSATARRGRAESVRRIDRRRPRRCTGICGSVPRPSDRTTRPIRR